MNVFLYVVCICEICGLGEHVHTESIIIVLASPCSEVPSVGRGRHTEMHLEI